MTKLSGRALTFALVLLGTACTPGPGATGSTSEPVATAVTAPTTQALGSVGPETFDEFVEDSFEEWTKRRPQLVTVLGLNGEYGTRPDQLDDLSPEYMLGTTELAESVLFRLRTFGVEALSPGQQITHKAFEWHLEISIAGDEFRQMEWPVHFLINSYNEDLLSLFMSVHPLTNFR